MSLIRWTPGTVRNVTDIRDEMDRLFDTFVGTRSLPAEGGAIAPPVDIEETPDAFLVTADLPGIDPKLVKVSMAGDVLTIRGERHITKKNTEGAIHRTERVSGSFERSFTLNTPVKAEQVKAVYRDGVLEIRVPKAEQAKVREIEVQVG